MKNNKVIYIYPTTLKNWFFGGPHFKIFNVAFEYEHFRWS